MGIRTAILLAAALLSIGTLFGQSQQVEVTLSGVDRQMAVVPARVVRTVTQFVVDPSPDGGDLIDIILADPKVTASLVRPDGREINAVSATGLSAEYSIGTVGQLATIPFGSMGLPGTHVVIRLGAGSPAGTYQVKTSALGIAHDSHLTAMYYSSSSVKLGASTPRSTYGTGQTVVVSGLLIDSEGGLRSATVRAEISHQDTLNGQMKVGSYKLVRQTAGDNGITEYEYRASLVNTGAARSIVTARLDDSDPSLNVVQASIYFGDVPAHGTVQSTTSFIVQSREGNPPSLPALHWIIEAPAPLTRIDLLDKGRYDAVSGNGLYSGEFVPKVTGAYEISILATGKSSAGVAFRRSSFTTIDVTAPTARITSVQDAAVDDNRNGKTSRLVVTVNADVQAAGSYRLKGDLIAANGERIETTAELKLGRGKQALQLSYSAADLATLHVDGPFQRRYIVLLFLPDERHDVLADSVDDAGPSSAITVASLDRGPLYLLYGQFSAAGDDTNGDGAFENLRVELGVSTPAGECSWGAILLDAKLGVQIGTSSDSGIMKGGPATVSLNFDGLRIAQYNKDTAFTVVGANITCGDLSIDADSSYTTPHFSASQFAYQPQGFALSLDFPYQSTPIDSPSMFMVMAPPGVIQHASVRAGGAGMVVVTSTPSGEFQGVVALKVSGLPPAITATWRRSRISGSGGAELQLQVGQDVPPGDYPFTIMGTNIPTSNPRPDHRTPLVPDASVTGLLKVLPPEDRH